jgi:hypothetical protein
LSVERGSDRIQKERKQEKGTHFLSRTREEQVRTLKKTKSANKGHLLPIIYGGKESQDIEIRQVSRNAHFLLCKEAGKSQAPKKVREQEAHTTYQAQREGKFRTLKERWQARDTYQLFSREEG